MLLLTAEGSRAEGATIGGAQRGRAVSHHWTWGGPNYNTYNASLTIRVISHPRRYDLIQDGTLPKLN